MSQPNPVTPFTNEDGPVFNEPWHATVLAIADNMITKGQFSASDWATALGAQLAKAKSNNAPDTAETYYQCAVTALEKLVATNIDISQSAMSERKETWARAYLATPHGKPVKLEAGKE